MLFSSDKRIHSRKFSFTPFYYQAEEEPRSKFREPTKRIHFKRTTRPPLSKKSFRIKLFFALLLIVFLYYFRGLIVEEQKEFDLESIRIEETPVF